MYFDELVAIQNAIIFLAEPVEDAGQCQSCGSISAGNDDSLVIILTPIIAVLLIGGIATVIAFNLFCWLRKSKQTLSMQKNSEITEHSYFTFDEVDFNQSVSQIQTVLLMYMYMYYVCAILIL